MRLTLQTDYTLRVLMFLGVTQDRLVTIKEIAETYSISKNHLMKIVHQLSLLGYIETTRGKNGGMRLKGDPSAINIGTVIRKTEPDMSIVECFMKNGGCRLEGGCELTGIMAKALGAFLAVLDEYTLADLLKQPKQLSELLALVE